MRDRIVVWAANHILALASKPYRSKLRLVILRGLAADRSSSPSPLIRAIKKTYGLDSLSDRSETGEGLEEE